MEKIIALAKKLKALSDRGVGGEKENATQMLASLMEKHGITFEMIDGEKKKTHELYLSDNERKFFRQIVSSVVGKDYRLFVYKYKMGKNPGKDRYGLEFITDADFIEIMAKFDFYWKHFLEEQEILYSAFVQKNKIWVKTIDEDSDEDSESPELTNEERARLFRVASMMQFMEKKNFNKQLGS